MSKNKNYSTDSSDNVEVKLVFDFLINIKGNYWKAKSSRKAILLNEKISDKDLCSNGSFSDEEYLFTSSEHLTDCKGSHAVDSSLPMQDMLEMREMEFVISKMKLYVLQLETEMSKLRDKRYQQLNDKFKSNIFPKNKSPLVIIHNMPETILRDNFNNRNDSHSNTFNKSINDLHSNSLEVYENSIATNSSSINGNLQSPEIDNTIEKYDESNSIEIITPMLSISKTRSTKKDNCSDDNSSMVSGITTVPLLSPFYHTSPGHFRKLHDLNNSLSGTESMPELSVVIPYKERAVANYSTDNSIKECGFKKESDTNIPMECQLPVSQNITNNISLDVEKNDVSNVKIQARAKRYKLFHASPSQKFACSPLLTNNVEKEIIDLCKKRKHHRNYIRNATNEIVKKLTSKNSFQKKKIYFREEQQKFIKLNKTDIKPLNLLESSLSNSYEQSLFSDDCSSNDSLMDIEEPMLNRKAIPKKSNYEKSGASSVKICYVKLIHHSKTVNGMKIFS